MVRTRSSSGDTSTFCQDRIAHEKLVTEEMLY